MGWTGAPLSTPTSTDTQTRSSEYVECKAFFYLAFCAACHFDVCVIQSRRQGEDGRFGLSVREPPEHGSSERAGNGPDPPLPAA